MIEFSQDTIAAFGSNEPLFYKAGKYRYIDCAEFCTKIKQLKITKFFEHHNLIIVRITFSWSSCGGKPRQLFDVSATTQ